MATVIASSVCARVAAPKVRRAPATLASRAERAVSGAPANARFRDIAREPRETLTNPSPSPPATSRSQRVAARRTFLGKGVAGLAPVRYARAPTESSLDPGAARARPGTPSRRGVTMPRRERKIQPSHPTRPSVLRRFLRRVGVRRIPHSDAALSPHHPPTRTS
jgi:hypothetical protein